MRTNTLAMFGQKFAMRSVAIACLMVAATGTICCGQTIVTGSALMTVQRSALKTCIIAYSQGTDSQGVAGIVQVMSSAPGTPAYEYQLGGQLAQAAFILADLGYVSAAHRAAAAALAHLDVTGAVLSSGSRTLLAQADEIAGLLQQRINRNLITAQKCYARAILRDPRRPLAKACLSRLNSILGPVQP